jgi:hypothetical protein
MESYAMEKMAVNLTVRAAFSGCFVSKQCDFIPEK